MAVLKVGAAAKPAPRSLFAQDGHLTGQAALDRCHAWLAPMRETADDLERIDRRLARTEAKFRDPDLLRQFPDGDDDFWAEGRMRVQALRRERRERLAELSAQGTAANAELRQIEIGTWAWLQLQVPHDLPHDPVWRWVGMTPGLREMSPWREWLLMHVDTYGEEAPF